MDRNKNAPDAESSTPDIILSAETYPASGGPPVRKKRRRRKIQMVGEYHQIGTAVGMSVFLPGAGQLYNNQIIKGILLILLTFGGIFAATAMPNPTTLFLGGKGEVILWIVGILDAALIARRLRHGQVVSVWKWF